MRVAIQNVDPGVGVPLRNFVQDCRQVQQAARRVLRGLARIVMSPQGVADGGMSGEELRICLTVG
jgi:hypothetical protein